ncbi:MAG: type II toxin-antitoxin system RelE/ParE family toxin [Chryseolinea sp.]
MSSKFEVLFLAEARKFLIELDLKTRAKILYNIDKSKVLMDRKLFKKLSGEIWEFRTKFNGHQYRLLAFWDKTDKVETLVISSHGFVKKVDKVPSVEIEKAENLRRTYFDQKTKRK